MSVMKYLVSASLLLTIATAYFSAPIVKQYNGVCEDSTTGRFNCADVAALVPVSCNPYIAADCRKTCQVCDFECKDRDDIIAALNPLTATGQGGDCNSNKGNCNNQLYDSFFQLYCPITCGICNPTPTPTPTPYLCADLNQQLTQFIGSTQLTCPLVLSNGFCTSSDPTFKSYCPVTCDICSRPYEDDDSAVRALRLKDTTTCAQVATNNFCNQRFFDVVFKLFCPVSCNTYPSGSTGFVTPTPTRTPTRTPTPTRTTTSSTPTPTPPTSEKPSGKKSNNTPVVVASVLLATAAVGLFAFIVLRRRGSPGSRRTRVHRSDDKNVVID